ncbi:uncharacterized protein CELE_F13G3.15, partial [Caenorhabditis elegans]
VMLNSKPILTLCSFLP